MTRREALPPRAAEWLLERTLPPAEGHEIAEDLRELFAHRRRERGVLSARLWYWKQVAIFIRRAGVFRSETGLEADSLRADVAYALRSLRRAPGFTAVAVLTLALGMGANIAIWSVVHHVVLRPLGYDAGDRLVRVWPEHHFTRKRFETFRDRTSSFETLSAYTLTGLTLTGGGEPGVVTGLLVSYEHFDVFGRKPLLGRSFTASDGEPGAEPVVIISHGMWRQRFGGLADVLGQRIELEERRTIIGVAAPGFEPLGSVTDVWVPLVFDPHDDEYTHMANLQLVAVLREDTSSESARAELEAVASGLDPPLYTLDEVPGYTVAPFHDVLVGNVTSTLYVLLGAVSLVLVLCCVNVTNLLMARGVARERELAIRQAMGASRVRIVRLLLTENAVLGLFAGVLGFVTLWLVSGYLTAIIPSRIPRGGDISLDGGVALIGLVLTVVATFLFGLAPALRASTPMTGLTTRGASSDKKRFRMHRGLVAFEIALSLALVAASGLLLKSFWRLQNVDTGFRGEAVVSIRVSPGSFRYPEEAQRVQYYQDVFEALRQLPGVTNVGAIHILPMTSQSMAVGYSPTGEPLPADAAPPMASYRIVTPDYRRSLGIPLLEGRDLDAFDRSGSTAVGLINEVLARELSPDESFLGRELKYENGEAWFTVVGVVGNVRQHRLEHEARPEVYVPLAQDAWPDSMVLVLRSTAAGTERYPLYRDAIGSVDGNVPITQIRSMQDVVESSMSEPRLRTLLFAGFALLAFVLSAVGIYGVMSYTVKERTHDIGIRMALGASQKRILRETLFLGMRPVLAGMGLGLLLSLFATRALAGFLFEVEGTDPAVYAVVACLLGGVALAAGFIPAHRASRSDPLEVLNAEN